MIIVNSDYAGDNNDGIIQQRIGTTAEWGNIIPRNGEVIIEITDKKDESGNNIRLARIGDGVKPVSQLPILGLEGGGVGEKTLDGGEIFNTYEDDSESEINKNQAYGKGSHAEGANTVAGAKGFQVNKYIKENNVEYLELKIDNTTLNNIKNYTNTIDNNSFNRYEEVVLIIDEQFITDTITIDLKSFTATGANGIVRVLITDYSNENIKTILQSNKVLNYMVLQTDTLSPYALTIASFAHAEGCYSVAFGNYSHVENLGNAALGQASHSEGYMTTAIGDFSHAGGQGSIAKGSAQTVIGKYNDPNTEDLFIIGNGDSEDERSNILSVNKDSVQVHKDLNVEQNINTANLNVTDNINTDNLKVNTVVSNSENSDINIQSKIIAEKGIYVNEESKFDNITVNEKIEVKDLEVTGEFILSGESAGDLITSDNFKGEKTLNEILNLPEENNKIGDRYIVSENNYKDEGNILFSTRPLIDRPEGNLYDSNYKLDNVNQLENINNFYKNSKFVLEIPFRSTSGELENTFQNTIPNLAATGNVGLLLNTYPLPYKYILNNIDSQFSYSKYKYNTSEKIAEITISSSDNEIDKKTYKDLINAFYWIKPVYSGCICLAYENLQNDGRIQFTLSINKKENITQDGELSFRYFKSLADWANNKNICYLKNNQDILKIPGYDNPNRDENSNFYYKILPMSDEIDTVLVSIPYGIDNDFDNFCNAYGKSLSNFAPCPLMEFNYENWVNSEKEDSFLFYPKNFDYGLNKTDLQTLSFYIAELEYPSIQSYPYVKPNDQAIWFDNKWNFISSPYSNIGIDSTAPSSLILNDINTNIANAEYSVICGQNNTDDGGYSLIGGVRNKNFDAHNLIWGQDNYSSSTNSFVFGCNNINEEQKDCNFVVGYNNKFNFSNNLIVGEYLQTSNDHQYIFGKYNELNENIIFAVGDGNQDKRHNLLQLTSDKTLLLTDIDNSKVSTSIQPGGLKLNFDGVGDALLIIPKEDKTGFVIKYENPGGYYQNLEIATKITGTTIQDSDGNFNSLKVQGKNVLTENDIAVMASFPVFEGASIETAGSAGNFINPEISINNSLIKQIDFDADTDDFTIYSGKCNISGTLGIAIRAFGSTVGGSSSVNNIVVKVNNEKIITLSMNHVNRYRSDLLSVKKGDLIEVTSDGSRNGTLYIYGNIALDPDKYKFEILEDQQ